LFRGKTLRGKARVECVELPKREVAKSIEIVDLRRKHIIISWTLRESKEKVEPLTRSHPKLQKVRS
jgi:hypothetical protein